MMKAAVLSAEAPNEGASGALAIRSDEVWPFYAEDEINAVADVLRSGRVNQWTSGTVVAFAQACLERFGGGHGIAIANGSLALELALRAFGIGPGDEVIVTPRSFVASAYCVRLVGAVPVFADIDRDSGNISPKTIEACVTKRTRAIIPVHLAGWPADMSGIMAVAERLGLYVIEDCAQAHGAAIGGQSVGSFGHAAAFSFCQDKIISTAGEGGFTSFRSAEHFEWAWSFKDHGKNRAKLDAPAAKSGFRWLHDSVGTNWRLTAPQAAVGLLQITKLDAWQAARRTNAMIWARSLTGVPGLRVPLPEHGNRHAFYKFYAYVDAGAETPGLRNEILRRATDEGIRLFSGSCSEVYLEQGFADLRQPRLPVAKELGESSLMMEVHPTLRRDLLEARAQRLGAIARDVLR